MRFRRWGSTDGRVAIEASRCLSLPWWRTITDMTRRKSRSRKVTGKRAATRKRKKRSRKTGARSVTSKRKRKGKRGRLTPAQRERRARIRAARKRKRAQEERASAKNVEKSPGEKFVDGLREGFAEGAQVAGHAVGGLLGRAVGAKLDSMVKATGEAAPLEPMPAPATEDDKGDDK